MADDILQQLTHIGSALGPVGVAISGWVGRAMARLTTAAEEGKKAADEALKVAQEAKAIAQGMATNLADAKAVSSGFSDLRGGLRLEMTNFKTGIEERFSQITQEMRTLIQKLVEDLERRVERDVERIVRGSRPEGVYENDALLVELRSKLDHERDQRIALQEALTGHMRDGVERWLKMERFIGKIESTVESWERERASERRALEERIDSLHREMRDLRSSRPR
jgi:hypothetical protein